MAGIRKGTLAAIAALIVLAGIVGWRFYTSDQGETADEASAENNVSTAPTLEELAQRAEEEADNPLVWQELGLAYFGANLFAEAASAYENAVEVDEESAVLWASLGEARVMASDDEPLPAPALEAFRRALELDGSDPRARYFLAVEKDLAGDHEGAITDWLALLADTTPGSPWESDLVRTVEQVAAINGIDVEGRVGSAASTRDLLPSDALSQDALAQQQRGPTQEQMTAAASLSADEQQGMAEAMVTRLADRMATDGGSRDDWVMLMRSYQQMGRIGEARRTRDSAVAAYPDSAEEIEQIAESLGIGPSES